MRFHRARCNFERGQWSSDCNTILILAGVPSRIYPWELERSVVELGVGNNIVMRKKDSDCIALQRARKDSMSDGKLFPSSFLMN